MRSAVMFFGIVISTMFMSTEGLLASPVTVVHLWCDAKAHTNRNKTKTLSQGDIKETWNTVINALVENRVRDATKSNDFLMQHLSDIDGLYYDDSTTKTGEFRPIPLSRMVKRVDVLKGLENRSRSYALNAACRLLSEIENSESKELDKFELNIEITKIGSYFGQYKFFKEQQELFEYGLFLLNSAAPARCETIFIGRSLCDGLMDSLINQNKYRDAAKHIDEWLSAVKSDVGKQDPDFLATIAKCLEIALSGNDHAKLEKLSLSLLESSSRYVLLAKPNEWVVRGSAIAKAHFKAFQALKGSGNLADAKEHARLGAKWATRMALGILSQRLDSPDRQLSFGAIGLARFLSEEGNGPFVNTALLTEWELRRNFLKVMGSKSTEEVFVRMDPRKRPSSQGSVTFTKGAGAVEDFLQRPSSPGDADELTNVVFEALVSDIEGIQGKYHPDAIELRVLMAKTRLKAGDRDGFFKQSDMIVSRISELSAIDIAGWETWQGHLENYRPFLTQIKRESIDAAISNPNSEEEFNRLLRVTQMLDQSRTAWAVASTLARMQVSNSKLQELLQKHNEIYDQLIANEYCILHDCAKGADDPEREKPYEIREAILLSMEDLAKKIKLESPSYSDLATPKTYSAAEITKSLKSNEAYVNIDLEADVGSVIIITNEKRIIKNIDQQRLDELRYIVKALDCGLVVDRTNSYWKTNNCAHILNHLLKAALIRPFDLSAAFRAYEILLGGSEALLSGKNLLVQNTGDFSRLPIQILVTKAPPKRFVEDLSEYKGISWLGLTYPVSLVSSVSNFVENRTTDKRQGNETERKFYLGIGNPILQQGMGELGTTDCKDLSASPALMRAKSIRVDLKSRSQSKYDFSNFDQLPQTGEEICNAAKALGSSIHDTMLGASASESIVKRLSNDGSLSQYSIIHFATHALTTREMNDVSGTLSEPAIVLTPPLLPTVEDDGLLTASEISDLKIGAQWVILSACNTAEGDRPDQGEALSGLARAFFTAGAHSLMVSHWPSDADATVTLTDKMVVSYSTRPDNGRALALKNGIEAMVHSNNPANAHPYAWGAFSLVDNE